MLQTLGALTDLPPVQATLLVLALSVGGALVVEFVVIRFAREFVSETSTEFDNVLLQELRLPVVVTVALAERLALDSPKPRMRFRRFGDSALEYELLCWVNNPTREARARHFLNREIYKGLNEAGIEIPYPKRDLSVRIEGDDARPPAARFDGDVTAGEPTGNASRREI